MDAFMTQMLINQQTQIAAQQAMEIANQQAQQAMEIANQQAQQSAEMAMRDAETAMHMHNEAQREFEETNRYIESLRNQMRNS